MKKLMVVMLVIAVLTSSVVSVSAEVSSPEVTATPEVTTTPEITATPEVTATPEATPTPKATIKSTPKPTKTPFYFQKTPTPTPTPFVDSNGVTKAEADRAAKFGAMAYRNEKYGLYWIYLDEPNRIYIIEPSSSLKAANPQVDWSRNDSHYIDIDPDAVEDIPETTPTPEITPAPEDEGAPAPGDETTPTPKATLTPKATPKAGLIPVYDNEDEFKEVEQDPNIPRLFIDGKEIKCDVPPMIINNRVMVPVRFIADTLGAKVAWVEKLQKVSITSKDDSFDRIVMTIGETTALVGDKKIVMTVPAQIVKGRTMVPIRFVGEAMNLFVSWNEEMRAVMIITK